MGLGIQGCMPPMSFPKELERLASNADRIISNYEKGSLGELASSGRIMPGYKTVMHQYERLIEYAKQGYKERMKHSNEYYFFKHDARLWSYYEQAVIKGNMGMRRVKIVHNPPHGFLAENDEFGLQLEHYIDPISTPSFILPSIKTPKQCFEQYLQPVSRSWHRMQDSKVISKKNLGLVKHFNNITKIVESLEPDNQEAWQFDEKKDVWEHGQRKDILIIHY